MINTESWHLLTAYLHILGAVWFCYLDCFVLSSWSTIHKVLWWTRFTYGETKACSKGVSPITELTAVELYSTLALPGPKPYPTPWSAPPLRGHLSFGLGCLWKWPEKKGGSACLFVFTGGSRRLHIITTYSLVWLTARQPWPGTRNTQTVPAGMSHLPNLSHTGPDGIWSWEQTGMQNWPFFLRKRRDEINLKRNRCCLQLAILKQWFPLPLLIIKKMESKRRHKWSPTITPIAGEGELVKLFQKSLLRAKTVQPSGGKSGNVSQNLTSYTLWHSNLISRVYTKKNLQYCSKTEIDVYGKIVNSLQTLFKTFKTYRNLWRQSLCKVNFS